MYDVNLNQLSRFNYHTGSLNSGNSRITAVGLKTKRLIKLVSEISKFLEENSIPLCISHYTIRYLWSSANLFYLSQWSSYERQKWSHSEKHIIKRGCGNNSANRLYHHSDISERKDDSFLRSILPLFFRFYERYETDEIK